MKAKSSMPPPGPGYDDAEMAGIIAHGDGDLSAGLFIEARSRMHNAAAVCPFPADGCSGEAWITVHSADVFPGEVLFNLSVYGKNFDQIIFKISAFPRKACISRDWETWPNAWNRHCRSKRAPGKICLRVPFVIDSVRRWIWN
jgi:hypothetical protein